MTNAVRHRLFSCQQSRDFDALRALCEELLNTQSDALVHGCCLWNLSDIYAMRRDAEALYTNHLRFASHLEALPPMYRLWSVSDATQRLTLEQGGHGDAWWQWYSDATATYDPSCEAALFNAHRAAFYKCPNMPYEHNRALWVKERFGAFLESACGSSSAPFYHLIFTALCLNHFDETEQDLFTCCKPFFADLHHPAEEPLYVAGEWHALNCHRSRRTQAQVGINAAVNALIDSGNTKQARKLYKTACEYGLNANDYIEQRL